MFIEESGMKLSDFHVLYDDAFFSYVVKRNNAREFLHKYLIHTWETYFILLRGK